MKATYIITDNRGAVLRDGQASDELAALLVAENYCNGLPQNHYCIIVQQYKSASVKVSTYKMHAPYGEPVQVLGEAPC